MLFNNQNKPLWLFICFLIMSVFNIPAHASFIMKLDNLSGTNVSITDNSASDLNSSVGVIVYIGAFGGFDINVTTGISKPTIGGASIGKIDLNSLNVASTGSGSLKISLTDTGFFSGSLIDNILLENQIGGTISGISSLTAQGYLDTSNAEFGTTGLTTGAQVFTSVGTTVPFANTASASLLAAISGPFSLTEVVTITHTGPGSTAFDKELSATPRIASTPEPGIFALLCFGLAGLSYNKRRKVT